MDVGAISVRSRRGLLPKDESGICRFGVGDIRTAVGGHPKCNSAGGGSAGSGSPATESGGEPCDPDRAGAVAAASIAGPCPESPGTRAAPEVVDVQWRSVERRTGSAVPAKFSGGDAVEYLWSVGSSGGCDVA